MTNLKEAVYYFNRSGCPLTITWGNIQDTTGLREIIKIQGDSTGGGLFNSLLTETHFRKQFEQWMEEHEFQTMSS